MRSAAIALAALSVSLLVPGSTLMAQAPLEPGTRIRVTQCRPKGLTSRGMKCSRDTGALETLTADSVVLAVDGEDGLLALSRLSIRKYEVIRGKKGATARGVGIGFLGGAVVFGLQAYLSAPRGRCTASLFGGTKPCPDPVRRGMDGVMIGGLLGAGLGALIGSAIKVDRWEEVSLDNVRVSFVPQRDGRFRLGMSVSF